MLSTHTHTSHGAGDDEEGGRGDGRLLTALSVLVVGGGYLVLGALLAYLLRPRGLIGLLRSGG
jgi:hypothetical protein